jgi:hypothetical protein
LGDSSLSELYSVLSRGFYSLFRCLQHKILAQQAVLVKEVTKDFSKSYIGLEPKHAGEWVAFIHRDAEKGYSRTPHSSGPIPMGPLVETGFLQVLSSLLGA